MWCWTKKPKQEHQRKGKEKGTRTRTKDEKEAETKMKKVMQGDEGDATEEVKGGQAEDNKEAVHYRQR